MKGKSLLAIITVILVSLGVLYLGFNLVQGNFTRANDERPENVTVAEVTPTSAKVSWSTPIETSGAVVQYGLTPTALTSFAPVEAESSTSQSVDMTLLTPGTTYYFEIVYGQDRIYNNAGVPWSFVTKSADDTPIINTVTDTAPNAPPVVNSAPPTSVPIATPVPPACDYTDCETIKFNLGKGCSTQEYIRCIKK